MTEPILNAGERLLLVALAIEERGERPFDYATFAVEAWERYPECFGFQGKPAYPDSHRVVSAIMGARGLVSRDFLEKPRVRHYQLTAEGTRVAQALRRLVSPAKVESEPVKKAKRARKAAEELGGIRHLLDSAAVEKFRGGQKVEITFDEASDFWFCGTSYDRGERLKNVTKLLEREREHAPFVLPDGREVSVEDVGWVMSTHNWMVGRFAFRLKALQERVIHGKG